MKEQLVTQLKTQVTDLERFIEFLQGPAEKKCPCDCSGTLKPGTASKSKFSLVEYYLLNSFFVALFKIFSLEHILKLL